MQNLFRCRIVQVIMIFCTITAAAQSNDNDNDDDDWYHGKVIKGIEFSGLRNVKLSDLEGLMEMYKGTAFNDEIFDEIQARLYALEFFEHLSPAINKADPAGNEIILRFTVTERPVISRINFAGNTGLRRNELMETVSTKVNDVFNYAKINLDKLAIVDKYKEKGYPNASVRETTQLLGDSAIQLTFNITEGDKITISDFQFEGNTVFSNKTLKGQLSLKAKTLVNDGAFQEAKLIADRVTLAEYYHDRGYIDAEVIDVSQDITKDAKGNNNLILIFKIIEGRKYTFGGITFEGNQIFSTEQLEEMVKSKEGETISLRKIEADFQRIADLYYENGYIFNLINKEEIKDDLLDRVSYNITIVEQGRAHIENIIIRGNEKTKTSVILREIPLESGDIFSKTKVMEAWRNLMNLQYFTMVAIETPPGSADSLMDLVFIVEEQPTTDLQFGLTFSGSADPETFPISGLVRWNDRNFRGSGNQLGADANASPDTANVSLNYNHRWIFGLPLSGGFDFSVEWSRRLAAMNNSAPIFIGDELYAFPDGFSTYNEYLAASKLPPNEFLMDYNQWYISLGFSTGYRWSTPIGDLTLSGGIRAGLIRNNYDNLIYRPFDPALRDGNNSWMPKNSFWTSVSIDQRDIYYDPSSGYYLLNRFGIYGLFGKSEREHYLRNDARAEYYITLFNIPVGEKWAFKTVLAFHTGLSLIFNQPGRGVNNHNIPFRVEDANKLSIDGMFIGRGWSSEYRIKGYALWENWAELRIPLVQGLLAFDFFFDAAGVETRQGHYFGKYIDGSGKLQRNFTIDNMRFSFGGGLRFTMPQFPFRFSLAKRFRTEDGVFIWEEGTIFKNAKRKGSGIDPVISFAISY